MTRVWLYRVLIVRNGFDKGLGGLVIVVAFV